MNDARRLVWLVTGIAMALVVGAIAWVGGGSATDPSLMARTEANRAGQRVKVQVLNAGGVDGLAREATGHLRAAGFDVVEYGDAASWDRDTTWVVDRIGKPDVAQAVADALGIDNVQGDPDPDLLVDVTVLLGRDWTLERASRPREANAAEAPWWNPRRWLDP